MSDMRKKQEAEGLPPVVLEFMEVQDRQYDPGYWLGGSIDPALRAKRPNRYGYVLLVAALVCAAFALYYGRNGVFVAVVYFGGLAVLMLLGGVKLLRKPKPGDA